MEKRVKNLSRADVMSDFIKEAIQNRATIFGGAVRDMIAGVEPTDIDIYFKVYSSSNGLSDPEKAEILLTKFLGVMNNWTFVRLTEPDEHIDWTFYSGANHGAPALVVPFLIGREEIQFKIDIVMSRNDLCFNNPDCIVNGLIMNDRGIYFVTNFEHEKLRQMTSEGRVELAKQLIAERRAGMFPDCDIHRIEKMKNKGYNTEVF